MKNFRKLNFFLFKKNILFVKYFFLSNASGTFFIHFAQRARAANTGLFRIFLFDFLKSGYKTRYNFFKKVPLEAF